MPTKKNFDGPKLQGSHTTVIEDGIELLQGIHKEDWLVSVRAGFIENKGKGGTKSLSIGKARGQIVAERTLRLLLKAGGLVQELFLQIDTTKNVEMAITQIAAVAKDRIRGVTVKLK